LDDRFSSAIEMDRPAHHKLGDYHVSNFVGKKIFNYVHPNAAKTLFCWQL